MKRNKIIIFSSLCVAAILAIILIFTHSRHLFFRIDLTDDGRYSLNESSKKLLSQMSEPLTLKLYLTGDLDANTTRLRRAVVDMVTDINAYAPYKIDIESINPDAMGSTQEEIYAYYDKLEEKGMLGMSVTQQVNGKVSEQIIFPWAQLCSSTDTMVVKLLSSSQSLSGESAINSAIENIEFLLFDAIRVLCRKEVSKIAFIEGHRELGEEYVYDASDALSRYFQIDRGIIGYDADMLNDYKAIIIAHPQEPFSEREKFIIDQYIMNGGSVLWLLDGAKTSTDLLASNGQTPMIALDCNLNDMLFRYGVRITPSAVEDMQCAYVPVNMARPGEEPKFEPIPWFFTPLLQTNPIHPVTKSVSNVKADFASGVEIVGDSTITKTILLVTSNASHVHFAPSEINIMEAINVEPQTYFYTSFIPIAVALEGEFTSVFQHRLVPDSVNANGIINKSKPAKMIVVGDGEIIKNDLEQHKEGLMVLPLGYDRVTKQTHGNKDFIVNAILYLTDDEDIMSLRGRTVNLHLLNRAKVYDLKNQIIAISVITPLLVLVIIGLITWLIRRKY